MEPLGSAVLGVLMRWVHVVSMTLVVGGVLFVRFALPPADIAALGDRLAARLRLAIVALIGALLGSGLFNLLTKASYPPGYHMWFGIKMLLVLHVFAVLVLQTRTGIPPERRARSLTGLAISSLIILLVSAWLRWLTLTAL